VIEQLQAAASEDAALLERLAVLVNDVYAVAEHGLWADGAYRTTPEQLAELTRSGELAVARVDGEIVGCIRVHRLDERTGEFGMLVAAPEHRGAGIGRELVRYAERTSRDDGMRTMQLELLAPREWAHPAKERLAAWYDRLGYRLASTGTFAAAYPHMAPLLVTPCDLLVLRKELG
jgi:GNAT superfamily N-acetyltransferase